MTRHVSALTYRVVGGSERDADPTRASGHQASQKVTGHIYVSALCLSWWPLGRGRSRIQVRVPSWEVFLSSITRSPYVCFVSVSLYFLLPHTSCPFCLKETREAGLLSLVPALPFTCSTLLDPHFPTQLLPTPLGLCQAAIKGWMSRGLTFKTCNRDRPEECGLLVLGGLAGPGTWSHCPQDNAVLVP